MDLINRKKLVKLKKKNKSNKKLLVAVDEFMKTIEGAKWKDVKEMKKERRDADHIHDNRFYFFDLYIHRVFCLMEITDNELDVLWVGTHDEYEKIFKNNKNTAKKWLRERQYIE